MQVQIKLSEDMVHEIDQCVQEGRFRSRSDAVRVIVKLYRERERMVGLGGMLLERSEEAKARPEILSELEKSEP